MLCLCMFGTCRSTTTTILLYVGFEQPTVMPFMCMSLIAFSIDLLELLLWIVMYGDNMIYTVGTLLMERYFWPEVRFGKSKGIIEWNKFLKIVWLKETGIDGKT